jgi:hypothetical protein
MLYPLIGPRLHGWLDDLVTLTYLLGAWSLHLSGLALTLALTGAGVHFLLTRFTDYPQGTWRVIRFSHHAYIELGEGIALLVATWTLLPAAPLAARIFLSVMGANQLGAFATSDYADASLRREP